MRCDTPRDLSDDMVKRADISIRRRDMNVVSPRIRTFRDLSEVDGGSNVDPRIRAKADPLPPDPASCPRGAGRAERPQRGGMPWKREL